MNTYIIIYCRDDWSFKEAYLGKLSGKEARLKVKKEYSWRKPPLEVMWTPRIVKNTRFYIGVY